MRTARQRWEISERAITRLERQRNSAAREHDWQTVAMIDDSIGEWERYGQSYGA